VKAAQSGNSPNDLFSLTADLSGATGFGGPAAPDAPDHDLFLQFIDLDLLEFDFVAFLTQLMSIWSFLSFSNLAL
jgi:hypothetical protein